MIVQPKSMSQSHTSAYNTAALSEVKSSNTKAEHIQSNARIHSKFAAGITREELAVLSWRIFSFYSLNKKRY